MTPKELAEEFYNECPDQFSRDYAKVMERRIAEEFAKAVAEEREACAKVFDEWAAEQEVRVKTFAGRGEEDLRAYAQVSLSDCRDAANFMRSRSNAKT